MIQTPSIDWVALSPTLATLAAAGLALLLAVLVPRSVRRPGAAVVVGVGLRGAGRRAAFG